MSLSNIGKITKAIQSSNIDDLYKLLKGTGSVEKAAELLSKYSNLGKDINAEALYRAFDLGDIAEAEIIFNNIGSAATGVGAKLTEMANTGKSALRGLWAVIKAHPIAAAITGGLAAGFIGKKLYDNYVQKQISSAKEAGSEWSLNNSNIQDQISQVNELKTALDSNTLSEQEAYNVKSQLLSIQQSLSESYGSQADGINLINGELETQIALMEELARREAEKFLTENKDGNDRIKDKYENFANKDYLGEFNTYGASSDAINQIVSKYKDNFTTQINESNGLTTLYFTGDATEANDVLNELTSKLIDIKEESGSLFDADALYKSSSDMLKSSKDIIDEYGKNYKNILNAEIVSDKKLYGTGENRKSAYKWLSEYKDAVNEYNDALISGDNKQIESTKIKFEEMDSSIQSLLKTDLSPFSQQFSDVKNELNESMVSAERLRDILSGNAENKDLTRKFMKDYADQFKEQGMDDVDFQNEYLASKNRKVKRFVNSAIDMGVIPDDTALSLQALTDIMAQEGYIKSETVSPIKDIKKEAVSLESLLTDVSKTAPTSIQDITDQFQSNISSIKSAMDSLKSGEFKDSDITDLIQQFPDLASEADNLEQGLSKLTLTKLGDTISGIRKQTSQITDPTKKKEAEDYIQRLINSVDLSNANFDNIQSEISKNIMGSGPDNGIRSGVMNQLFGMYSGDENGMLAMLKLSVDPSMANASLNEWISKIESLRPQIEIDADIKILNDLSKDLSYLQNDASRIQSNINNKSALGLKVDESDYYKLIKNGDDQISNLKEQIKYAESLKEKYKDNETLVKSHQDQINGYYDSITQMEVSQFEWNKSMQNLPVTYAKELSSAMSSAMSEIQSSTGLTSDTIDTLRTQFSNLENVDISDLFYNSAKGAKVNTSVLKDLVEQQNKIQSGKFADEINRQKQAIQQYQDMIGKNNTNSTLESMQSNLEGLLQRQAQYFAEYQNQLSQLSQFQAIQNAKNTENAGSHYDQIISDVKAAKKAYDNDLVGTDDFKTVAEYLSPNGFADAANFNENYTKAKRYLTEDSSKGVLNFLNDLKKKGYATYETLANGVKQWSVNIADAEKAAYDMGMGEEFFTDVYNKLEDYGFVNTAVSSLTEGSVKIEEANSDLVKAYAKLAEMQASGAPEYAIEQQKQVVSELEGKVVSLTDATEQYKKASAQSYAEGLAGLKDQVDFLESVRKEAEKNGNDQLATGLESVIKSLANEYGIKLDYDQNGGISLNETSYSDALSKYQIGSFKNPLTAEQMGIGIEEAGNFESAKNAIIEQKDALQDYFSVLQQYSQEDLSGIKLSNGAYEVEGEMKSAEDALQGIADKLGLSQEQATQLVSALTALGVIKPKVDVKDIQNGIDKLHELQESGEINTTINFDADITEMSNDELADRFNELMVIKAGLEVNTDEYDAICALIEQTQVQMHINTVLESTNGDVESALGMTDEEIALECGINVNDNGAQEKIDSIRSGLEEIKQGANSSITVRMDDTQFGQLIDAQSTSTITVDANNEPAKEKINEAVEYGDSQTAEMTVKANTAPAISAASSAVRQINSMQATVPVNANTNGLAGQVQSALSSASYGITVHANVVGAGEGGAVAYTGTAFSPASISAHAYGNAYNVINYKNAYSNGKIGLKQDETALVNELGQESIIRGDKWLLLPPGMHTQALKKGDIVLNHLQTRDLLKHGKAFGHGKAYANGSATDGMPAHVSVTNSQGALGHNKYTGTATGSGTADIKSNTDALKKNTDSNNDNTNSNNNTIKEIDELIKKLNENIKDWIEISLDRAERLVDKYKTKADNYGGFKKTDQYLVKTMAKNAEYIKTLEKSMNEYKQYRDNIAAQLANFEFSDGSKGLSKDTLKKIKKGAINVQSIPEDVLKAINLYEEWYNKYLDTKDKLDERKQNQKEYAEQRVQNVLDSYDIIIGKREAAANLAESNQNLRVLQWKNQKPGTEYYKQMEKQLKYTEEQATLKDKEIKEYKKQMDNYLKENGNNTKDPVYQAMTKQLIELKNESVELQIAAEELKDKLQETKEQVLEWRFDRWDRAGQKQDAVINYKLVTDEKDFQIKEKDYVERMKTTNSQINALKALRDEKYKDYLQNVTTMNNEQAQAALEELAKIDVQIMNLGADMEELKNKIMELRWEPFYEAQDQLKGVISEYDTLRQLIGDEANFNDDGSFTVQGTTNLLLLQESIDATKLQIANYRKQLDNLEEQYKNGCFSEQEYIDKTKELQEGIRSAATSMESYRQTMLDMYSTQIEMENDLLQDNIDKRLEALDAKEKYYDYDKTLKKKNKDINVLKAQIAALEGTTNAASRARLETLKAELAEAEEDMADTVHQHEVEMKKTGFENMASDAEKALQNTQDALKKNTDFQEAVINNMLATVKNNYDDTYAHLNTVIEDHGIVVSKTFDEMITKVAQFNTELVKYTQAMQQVQNSNNSAVNMGSSQETVKNTGKENETSQGAGNEHVNDVTVSLSRTSFYMHKGESRKITATTKPVNLSVTWKSDNSNIATVAQDGTITAVNKGKAVITAEVKANAKATCTIYVVSDAIMTGIRNFEKQQGRQMTYAERQQVFEMAYNATVDGKRNPSGEDGIEVGQRSAEKIAVKNWFDSLKDFSGTIPEGTSALASAIMRGGKIASRYDFQKLADMFGIKTPGADKYEEWGKDLKNALLRRLRQNGFSYAKGGVVRDLIPADISTMLGKAAIRNGDSGFISANPGEAVLTQEFTKLLKPSVAAMNDFVSLAGNNFKINPNIGAINNTTMNNSVNVYVDKVSSDVDINTMADTIIKRMGKSLKSERRKI